MDWNSEQHKGALVVIPGGAINHENADDLHEHLIPAVRQAADQGDRLIIDFAAVDYMSSVGLRAIMRAAKEAQSLTVSIAVANLNETMADIFKISRFDKLFPVHDSVEAALAI